MKKRGVSKSGLQPMRFLPLLSGIAVEKEHLSSFSHHFLNLAKEERDGRRMFSISLAHAILHHVTAFWDLCADWHGRLARTCTYTYEQARTFRHHCTDRRYSTLELWSQQEFVRSVPTGTGTITCTVLLNCIESSIGSVLDLILFLFNLTLLLTTTTTTTTTREHQPTTKKPRDAQWHRALPVAISRQ